MPTATKIERLPRMSPKESAEFQARLDAVIASGMPQIKREQKELVRLGILDAEGNRLRPFVPPHGSSGQNYDAEG
jgi:hypothetical protein